MIEKEDQWSNYPKWQTHCLLITQVKPRLKKYTTTVGKLLSIVEKL